MTCSQLKAVVSFKKRKGDAAIPSKKELLVKRFNETYQRVDLNLNEWLEQNRVSFADEEGCALVETKDIPSEETDRLLL